MTANNKANIEKKIESSEFKKRIAKNLLDVVKELEEEKNNKESGGGSSGPKLTPDGENKKKRKLKPS